MCENRRKRRAENRDAPSDRKSTQSWKNIKAFAKNSQEINQGQSGKLFCFNEQVIVFQSKAFLVIPKTSTKFFRIQQQVSLATDNTVPSVRITSTNADETADLFNRYFNSVFLKETEEIYHRIFGNFDLKEG